jgi:hypothetical protein
MRGLLAFACRAFPADHRARRSDEVIDTALLAADGSPWRAARESLSLVLAGARERCRAEPRRSLRDGIALLAGLLALMNLAVALSGISLAIDPHTAWNDIPFPCCFARADPYVVDWWWIAFAAVAVAIVLGQALGNRMLALCATLANVGLVGYDTTFVTGGGYGHLNALASLGGLGYPIGTEWLAPAVVLVLATAGSPRRRRSLLRLPLTLAAAGLLAVPAREIPGGFFFLRWPVAVLIVLATTLGWLLPRIAVVGAGVSLVLAPYVVEYLTTPAWEYKDPVVTWVAAPGLALGIVLPFALLTRRRLT